MKEKQFEWARATVARLEQEELQPTPENYSLFFAYYSGRMPGLNQAIDKLTARHGSLSQEQCGDLYTAHLGMEKEQQVLEETNTALDVELRKVMSLLDQANTGTRSFDKTLTNFSGELQAPRSIDQLRAVVKRVATETKVISDQNVKLQKQLSESTEQMAEMRTNLDKVRQESLIDALTKVGNRKFFQDEIARLTAEATETHESLCLLMIDIDYFKKFNDTHGHLVGDQVLRLVGHTLTENVKGRDVICRYGGEEFAIMLPATPLEAAGRVADQLRVTVGTKKITRKPSNESLGTITLSIGVTQYVGGEPATVMVERADGALYKAKQTGRNKVMIAPLPRGADEPQAEHEEVATPGLTETKE
ncbi:MAG: diguanylate cyclase [Alphaproteobacteria bacterium]|nr:diguanylate cyclase [Alphaproteobacteria bacterium]